METLRVARDPDLLVQGSPEAIELLRRIVEAADHLYVAASRAQDERARLVLPMAVRRYEEVRRP